MAITRSFENNGQFLVTDLTEELMLVPNTWGRIGQLGIFSNEPVSQHTVTVESYEGTLSVIPPTYRGDKNTVNKDDTRSIRAFPIPHYNLMDFVTPQDLQGRRGYGNTDAAMRESEVVARKLQRIRQNHAVTVEFNRARAITEGKAYGPNGTVIADYYSDFGVTRTEVEFETGTPTTDIIGKIETVIADIQDNALTGGVMDNIVGLCSPEFFQALITHSKVVEAYQFYASTQEPLRRRLGEGLYRTFVYGGVEFQEYRGEYNGVRLIPANTAFFLPMGMNSEFVSYMGPANKLSLANTLGMEAYVFQYRDPRDENITLDSEHNHLHVLRRPKLVLKAWADTAP